MVNPFREMLRRSARAILLTVAVLYSPIDRIFLSLVRPLRQRIMALSWMRKSREWVGNLNRYAALLLLLVPWPISGADQTNRFPPVLPQASFGRNVAHRGWRGREAHLVRAAIGMAKPKLMSFHWFAWRYGAWRAAIEHPRLIAAWHRMRDWYRTIRAWVQHRYLQWTRR